MANAITIRIDADAARAISQINETALATGRLDAASAKAGATWTSTGKRMKSVGASMTRNLTIPLAIAGGAAVKTAVDFNTSLTHIQALVGASASQMEEYRKSILALGPATGKGPKELADALYFVTSSGFKGAAALRILAAGARASAAGLGDTQTVVDLVTSAVNAYGEKSLSASKATDILTAAVREGKAEPQELAAAMGRVIPLANAMGVSFGEASGSVAALTLSGLDADEAVTAVRGALTNILKPGADAKKALEGVGLSAAGLKREVAEKGLQAALVDLNDRFKGNTTEMGRVIPNTRALAGVLSLIGPNADKAAGTIREVNAAAGDTAKAFDKASDSTQFKFNQSLAQLQVTGVKVGTDLIPILIQVAGTVGSVAEAFDGLSPSTQKFIVEAGLVLAALGPVVSVVGNVSQAIGGLKKASAKSGLTELLATSGGFGPWGLLIGGAVAGVAAAFLLTRDDAGAMSNAMDDAKSAANDLGDALRNLRNGTLDVKQSVIDERKAVKEQGDAHRDLAKLINAGKKGTEEYRNAVDRVKQADIDAARGAIRHRDALAAQTDDRKAVREAVLRQIDAVDELSGAATTEARAELLRAGHTAAAHNATLVASTATGIYKRNVDGLARSEVGLSEEMKKSDPIRAAEHRRLGLLALAAEDLTNQLGHVPTKHQIDVYYKRNLKELQRQADELGASIRNIHDKTVDITMRFFQTGHIPTPDLLDLGPKPKAKPLGPVGATGAIVRRPTVALIGEAGDEAVIPLSRTRGNSPLPSGNLGGGNTYNVVIHTQNLDARKLKRELDLLTARRG